ncbi:2-hydroxyacid dehydrogenase [Virgibacillus xinjiangensis]|uniref:2-hydroxyacid dehydrogenase n=1 Tax=Virgibacillus xinjiangensis TaxID=393090 RepID=A0ABV7CYY3_9BACI
MKPKVFITDPIPPEVEKYIGKFCEYKIGNRRWMNSPELFYREIKNVDGLLTRNLNITNELLSKAPCLKIVSNISVGYDNFNLQAMKDKSVLGTHTPYVLDETVADTIMGLIIMTSRKLGELNEYVKKGKWGQTNEISFFGQDVHHSNLGIIGMGRISEKVVRRATLGFEMKVSYHSRTRKKELEDKYDIKYMEKNQLLESSDFVLIMLPLTTETYHFIGKEDFELMQPTSYLINCSRGKVVDEKALINALQANKIRGAGLDVYEEEPIKINHPFLDMSNVITLPHVGSATKKTRLDMAFKAAENLVAGVYNKAPENIVQELRISNIN